MGSAIINGDTIAERIRELLHDAPSAAAQRRWSSAMLGKWMADAQREIITRYPEYAIKSDGTEEDTMPIPPPPDTLFSSAPDTYLDFSIHQACAPAIIDYVCARAFEKDAEEGNLDVSAGYMKSFNERLRL